MDAEDSYGKLSLGISYEGRTYRLAKEDTPYTRPEVGSWLGDNPNLKPTSYGWKIKGEEHIKWDRTFHYFYEAGLDGYLQQYDYYGKIGLLHTIKKHLGSEEMFGVIGKRFFAWWFFSTGGEATHNWVWNAHKLGDAEEDWDGCVHTSYNKYGKGGAISGKGKHGSSHKFQHEVGAFTHTAKVRPKAQGGKFHKQ